MYRAVPVSEIKGRAPLEKTVCPSGQETRLTPAVSFIGASNSGKTTLLEKVVAGLKAAGYRVAVIKHSPHGFDIDRPGKDTWRLAHAGSDVVAVSSPDGFAIIERTDDEFSLGQLRAMMEGKADIILVEGYKSSDIPKLLVRSRGQVTAPIKHGGELLATIPAGVCGTGEVTFDREDLAAILALLIKRIELAGRPGFPPGIKKRPGIEGGF